MLHLLFFRGHGIVPVLVRLFCWRWWGGQRWRDVPAHVAIWDTEEGIEYEAIVTGIRSGRLESAESLPGLIESVPVALPEPDLARRWLMQQVGKRYGFEAVALTGLTVLSPSWLDLIWARCWARLQGGRSGRTSPLHCSLLCLGALEAAGFPTNFPGFPPVSPNDLMLGLRP